MRCGHSQANFVRFLGEVEKPSVDLIAYFVGMFYEFNGLIKTEPSV